RATGPNFRKLWNRVLQLTTSDEPHFFVAGDVEDIVESPSEDIQISLDLADRVRQVARQDKNIVRIILTRESLDPSRVGFIIDVKVRYREDAHLWCSRS